MSYKGSTKGESFWSYWWYHLHLLAEYYPLKPTGEDQSQIRILFETLSKRIICNICRRHFNAYINENPYYHYLNSKSQLRQYFTNLHNQINIRTNKKIVTLEETLNIYQDVLMKNKVISTTGLDVCKYFDDRQMRKFVLDMNNTFFNNRSKQKKKDLSESKGITSEIKNKIKPIQLVDNSPRATINKIRPKKKKKKNTDTPIKSKVLSPKIEIDENLWEYYLNKYDDLQKKYQQKQWPSNKEEAIQHYINCGISEGRKWGL